MSSISNSSFVKYSWFLLGMVFLVILAGGVVRMTQSGMGCPDWPRCFGMWIPPTEASQLPADFEKYLDKQDIDHSFNVYHTWIEYINRLLGAILGLFIIGNLGLAIKHFRGTKYRSIIWTSLFLLIAVGFQGWLGKLVVDSNLSVVKITIHMLVAILIAAVPLYHIAKLKESKLSIPSRFKTLMWVMFGLVIVQIIFGTQVREQIDEISKSLAYEQRELWIEKLDVMFIIHRSFSWLILLSGLYLWRKGKSMSGFDIHSRNILIAILGSVALGIVMYKLSMPAIAQPLHLVFACVLSLGLLYTLWRTSSTD